MDWTELTSKTGRNEHPHKSTKPSNKWCTRDGPILETDKFILAVCSEVDENANNNEKNDGRDLQGRQDILYGGKPVAFRNKSSIRIAKQETYPFPHTLEHAMR